MGVPGFFVWLMKNNIHNNIIQKTLQNIDNLYFDANCLFHPKCFEILKLYSDITDTDKLEKLMIDRIIKYISYIINFVNPNKLIYIAVDGVAPIAKINQQRKRRYKSVIDKEYNDYLNKKYNVQKNTSWSNIVITPGTDFMIRLDHELQKFAANNKKIIYSSYNQEGEGEHKIIRYIKNNQHDEPETHVIYGLDADLIFLAMGAQTNINNIYLLREQQHLNNSKDIKLSIDDVSEPLSYLCIKNVIKTYNDYITNKLRDNTEFLEPELYKEINKKLDNANYDFSKDFIILCFMLGNDFIPHLPSINIRNDGIEYITEAYCKMFELTQQLIYDDKTKELNYNNLKIIFDYLGELEDEYFKDVLPKFKQRSQNRKCNAKNDYERELWEHDNLKNIIQEDYIKLGDGIKEDYKFRYYEHNFHSRINQHKLVNNICKNYVDMMNWITRYYFDIDMPSWQFCYYFDEAPFASDIANYLYDENGIIKTDIEYKNPIKIEKQLLSVIPPYYIDMLKKIKNIDISKFKTKKTQYMFPTQYNLDYNNDQYWMCEVKLPVLDLTLF